VLLFAAAPLVMVPFILTAPLTAVHGAVLLLLFVLFIAYVAAKELRTSTPVFRNAEILERIEVGGDSGGLHKGSDRPADRPPFLVTVPFSKDRKLPGWAGLGLAVVALVGVIAGATATSFGTEGIISDFAIEGTLFGATIATSTVYAQSGSRSLRITDRNQGTWQGAEYNLLGQAAAGDQLGVSLYARVEGDPSEPVLFTMRSTCSGASTVYTPLATGTATNTGWVALSGNGLVPSCTLTELVVYAEGPRTGVILHIDNVTVARQTVSCGTLPPASLLTGTFVSTSDTGGSYCVDLRVTNNTAVEQSWRATFALNGTRITSTTANLTLDTTGNGIVRLVPNQAIPANTTQQGIFGVCASRTSGNALPSTPRIHTQY
jgi:hypothetical protein